MRCISVNIQVYRTFLTVVQCKSFTQAAQFLNFTQPTISNHIAILEENYGVSFFTRDGKNIYLTSAGRALVPIAKKLLLEYEDSLSQLAQYKDQGQTLRIAVSTQVINYYLLDILTKLKQEMPDVDIIVERRMTIEEAVEDTFKNKNYDFCFVHIDVQPLYCKRIRLWKQDLVWAASTELYAKHNQSKNIYEYPFIGYCDNGVYHKILKEKVDLSKMHMLMRFSDSDTMLEAIKASLGISVVPEFKLHEYLARQEMIIIDREHGVPLPISVLYDMEMDFTTPKLRFLELLNASKERFDY